MSANVMIRTATSLRWRSARYLVAMCAVGACTVAQAAISASERQVLLDIYASANGPAWTANSGWNGAPGTECSWARVTCDAAQSHVVQIDLVSNNLSGTLPPSLTPLTALVFFSVDQNALTGSIPQIAGMTSLQYVYFSHNRFTGSLPSFNGLYNLDTFYAHVNLLTGVIPPMSDLAHLRTIGINNNALSGPLPTPVAGSVLTYIYLGNNQFSGTIPDFHVLSDLAELTLDHNQLTGPLPNLSGTNLTTIYVNNNHLSGALPAAPSTLAPNNSGLCPNLFDTTPSANDAAWNIATGATPWWATPSSTNFCDEIFPDSFEA